MTETSPRSTEAGEPRDPLAPQRLQKFLSSAGVASRRGAEDLVREGRVAVNGDVVTEMGRKVDPREDVVEVDGEPVGVPDARLYLAMHKPPGYVTTLKDPQGRPSVRDLLPPELRRVFAVGRLDRDTQGLLLFTDDGEFAHRLMHPRYHVPKTYLVEMTGELTDDQADALRQGVELDDGPTRPAEVEVVSTSRERSVARITIREGRKRQVRRMFGTVRHTVTMLVREDFGPVGLGDQEPGTLRELSAEEVAALKREAGMGS